MFNNSKTDIAVLQLALKRAGLYSGEIDGIFGSNTIDGVRNFNITNNITPQNEVTDKTIEKLFEYLSGYITYTIMPGDTYYELAKRYNTTLENIRNANPDVNENNLITGSSIIIPITDSVTPTDINYNSYLIGAVYNGISKRFPFIKLTPIAKSVWGELIYLMQMGVGEKKVFINASHHANEWITTPVVFKFIEDYAKAYVQNGKIADFDARDLYNKTQLFMVAAVNPDGIDIVNSSVNPKREEEVKVIANNYPAIPYPDGWKANANGVDLNLNYPAGWEEAKKIKYNLGYTTPAPRDFVGSFPLSQPESRAMYDLTVRNNFDLTLSYHTQGETIYWKYLNYLPENSLEIGQKLADASGYELSVTPTESGYAGYKDWFILTYNKPGYTIEAGLGENPLPISDFDSIYEKNLPLMANALYLVSQIQ